MHIARGQKIPILNLSDAVYQPVNIKLSEFVKSITYIPLETSPGCLIDQYPDVYTTRDFILIITDNKCLLFDKKNGKYIRQIGHYGKDPGGYKSVWGFFNESLQVYYFIGWNGNLIKYSLNGNFLGSVKIPHFQYSLTSPSIPIEYSYLNDTLLVCSFSNFTGIETKSIMVFTEKGEVIKIFPNKYIYKNKKQVLVTFEIRFHHFNKSLYFHDRYIDTVYRLTAERFIPAFVLNRGKFRPTYESRWWPKDKKVESNLIFQPMYFENSNYITFNFDFNKEKYFGLYNKLNKSFKASIINEGIKNDVDGFLNLIFSSTNIEGELVCLIQPDEVLKWKKQNSVGSKTTINNLSNVKMEDNPIVIIAKTK